MEGTISNGNGFNKKFFITVLICLLLILWSKVFAFILLYLVAGYGLMIKRFGKEIADNMGISILWWPKLYFGND
jgi:hypothetical protein